MQTLEQDWQITTARPQQSLAVSGTPPISMRKAQVLSSRPLSVSDQQASSSWHTVCSGETSADILLLLWFTTLNCGHLISAYSLRHKTALAFADNEPTRSAVPHSSKEGQDVWTEQGWHCKPPKYSDTNREEEKKKRNECR